jgi:TonB family protein
LKDEPDLTMEMSPEVIASHSTPVRSPQRPRPRTEMATEFSTQSWKHLEGQVVGGKFPLTQYLGGSEDSAVFLTERPQGEPRKAAIKLMAAKAETAARQLSRWAEAEKMSNPHLIRLFEMGRWRSGKQELLYLVMEYAEEDLSQVVATRALTPRECQEMMPAVLQGLAYLHRHGFVHAHLKPANIMAVEDRVKISSDGLCQAGEARSASATVYDPPEATAEGLSSAADVWSLGMTLVEVLTRKAPLLDAGRTDPILPPATPTPLCDVVRHCLRLEPKQRWTIGEIEARLARAPKPPAPPVHAEADTGRSWKPFVIPVAALVLIVGVVVATVLSTRPRKNRPPSEAQLSTPKPAVTPAPPAKVPAAPEVKAAPARNVSGSPAVIHEVVPRVPQSARNTIQGTIRVRVRVALDQKGAVRQARFDSRGPSNYFARLAMEAAQGWKFSPPEPDGPNPAKEWLLRFEFRRDSTHVVPTPVGS